MKKSRVAYMVILAVLFSSIALAGETITIRNDMGGIFHIIPPQFLNKNTGFGPVTDCPKHTNIQGSVSCTISDSVLSIIAASRNDYYLLLNIDVPNSNGNGWTKKMQNCPTSTRNVTITGGDVRCN